MWLQLLDELEIVQKAGGKILDWHTCDIFPERWIDLVVVLRCDHELLWSRLEKRFVDRREATQWTGADTRTFVGHIRLRRFRRTTLLRLCRLFSRMQDRRMRRRLSSS